MIEPDLLTEAVHAFSMGADADSVLRKFAAMTVPAAADWCLADRLDDPDLITRVAARGVDGPLDLPPELGNPAARRSSAQAQGLLARLMPAPHRLLRLSADDLRAMSGSAEPRLRAQAQLGLRLNIQDLLILGLVGRDQLLGVVSIGRAGRNFEPAEVQLLVDMALVAGMALDNARLLQVQRGVSTALQTSLLPPLPHVEGLTIAARYVPAGRGLEVGGDWYDVFRLPSEDVALVIGDATGHDVGAAARMAELRNLLRACAVDHRGSPAQALTRLDQISVLLGTDAAATTLYAQLHRGADAGWQVTWSSAGHLPPVLLTEAGAELLDTPPDLMLGVEPETARTDHVRALRPGDVLVLFTDGLVEERRTTLGDRLGLLRERVEQAGGLDPELLADLLVADLAAGQDDVAVLIVRVDS